MILSYTDIHVTLGRKEIVKGISLSTTEGKMTGIIGPNGCGKSTLIKTTFGMVTRSRGDICLDGRSIVHDSPKKIASRIGYVGQDTPCAFDFSVFEIVSMGYSARLDKSRPMKAVVEEALESLSIGHLRERSVLSLSGGERKLVFIARAIVQGADVLVLDEPTNHLDIQNQLFLLEYLKGSGKTILIVLHDLRLASHYCDDVYLLSKGEVVAHGTPLETLTKDRIQHVFGIDGYTCQTAEGIIDFALFGENPAEDF